MACPKAEAPPCAPHVVVDFAARWQHLHPTTRLEGLNGLREVIGQLQGVEVVTAALERELLAGRVADYHSTMLDELIGSGEVCWRRASGHRVQRGKVTLCFRTDAEWIGRGREVRFDVEARADSDIPEAIIAVRSYFRQHGRAWFDEVVSDTGLEEGPTMRAVWYLAWCGELTCDTYECLRYSDFQVPVSACYDLHSRPERLQAAAPDAGDWPVQHMWKRGLDPGLAEWSATERLVPPSRLMQDEDIRQRWAGQLLRRWGIVTREIVAAETASPIWRDVTIEFRRLELLGEVSRGHYIEGHSGEQYAVPDAIDLLRDCCGRRRGGDVSYLKHEPVLGVTNRDPANLYGSCLPILDERGERYGHSLKRGSVVLRFALQAGQVLLWSNPGWAAVDQLVSLTRAQLADCVEAFRRDPDGREAQITLRKWNGFPVEVSPVGHLLWEMGFRFEDECSMVWPPGRVLATKPRGEVQDPFPAYYLPQGSHAFGRDWTLEHASDWIRQALDRVLDVVVAELNRDGWTLEWRSDGPYARYHNAGWFIILISKRNVCVRFGTPSQRRGKETHRFRETFCANAPEKVDAAFIERFRQCRQQTEDFIDHYLRACHAN